MQVKQKRDQYRPKVRTSRNYCLQPASDAILELHGLKRPEPERGIQTDRYFPKIHPYITSEAA